MPQQPPQKKNPITPAEKTNKATSEAQPKEGFPEESFVALELKSMAYTRLLRRAQHQMSPGERSVSKFIHHPGIDGLSHLLAQSFGRLSGIVTAALFAFIGTPVYFFLTRSENYKYSFLVLPLLLAIGFILGLLIELLIRMLKALFNKN